MRPRAIGAFAAFLIATLTGFAALAQFAGEAAGHPAEDYRRAAALFRDGQKDEAVGWFYRGQLRARIHLAARPGLEASGDPALFASLNEVVGRPINEYAFGDIPKLAATLDRVLAWHAGGEDRFTPKAQFARSHAEVSAGLRALRDQVVAGADSIRAQRLRNGLPNVTPPGARAAP